MSAGFVRRFPCEEGIMTADASWAHEIDVEDVEYIRHGAKPLLARLFKPREIGRASCRERVLCVV